jgi:hypothetical protein
MLQILDELHTILEQEQEREPHVEAAWRAAEGVYGFVLDHPELSLQAIAQSLRWLVDEPPLEEAARTAARVLLESDGQAADTRGRPLARRGELHPSALELARENDLFSLRRLPARALRFALQSAKPSEAKALIEAWNAMPLYEQTHT